mgnify:CR=1 FL=1
MHLLVVDDDETILQLVSIYLEQAGYNVKKASNAEAALAFLQKQQFDLIIIDVMMPGMDGYSLENIVNKAYGIPIIMLTAKGQIEDKQKGFEQGIDDYIVKPFETKELLFRVNAVLRRYQKSIQSQCVVGNVKMNTSNFELVIGDKQYIWPMRELEILSYLLLRKDMNVSRWDLIEELWGETLEQPEYTLNTHINRIRDRLKRAGANIEIVTIRGFGYRLGVKE